MKFITTKGYTYESGPFGAVSVGDTVILPSFRDGRTYTDTVASINTCYEGYTVTILGIKRKYLKKPRVKKVSYTSGLIKELVDNAQVVVIDGVTYNRTTTWSRL